MKTKVGTLLAVTLATSAPAAAGPEHDHARPRGPRLAEQKAAYLAWEAEQDRVDAILLTYGIARPRELRTGAPACGNVQTKSVPDWQAKCFAAHAAEERQDALRRKGNS